MRKSAGSNNQNKSPPKTQRCGVSLGKIVVTCAYLTSALSMYAVAQAQPNFPAPPDLFGTANALVAGLPNPFGGIAGANNNAAASGTVTDANPGVLLAGIADSGVVDFSGGNNPFANNFAPPGNNGGFRGFENDNDDDLFDPRAARSGRGLADSSLFGPPGLPGLGGGGGPRLPTPTDVLGGIPSPAELPSTIASGPTRLLGAATLLAPPGGPGLPGGGLANPVVESLRDPTFNGFDTFAVDSTATDTRGHRGTLRPRIGIPVQPDVADGTHREDRPISRVVGNGGQTQEIMSWPAAIHRGVTLANQPNVVRAPRSAPFERNNNNNNNNQFDTFQQKPHGTVQTMQFFAPGVSSGGINSLANSLGRIDTASLAQGVQALDARITPTLLAANDNIRANQPAPPVINIIQVQPTATPTGFPAVGGPSNGDVLGLAQPGLGQPLISGAVNQPGINNGFIPNAPIPQPLPFGANLPPLAPGVISNVEGTSLPVPIADLSVASAPSVAVEGI